MVIGITWIRLTIVSLLVSFSLLNSLVAQVPAFPGAEGGGMYTTGGRGGKVIYVENLDDKGNGSFRKAIEATGSRIIVFKVSGNIELQKPIYIKNGDVTIAGQSAPGDGICLVNYGMVIEADNVIVRYLRIRPGEKSGKELDAISCIRNKNIIIDHCSLSWGTDEVASFYENENFTLQWSIVSESLNNSIHSKGTHGYGGIWGGKYATFHHNLISDHTSRNPRFHGSRYNNNPDTEMVDFRNNVIYNWGNNSIYGGEEGQYNIVNNYFKPGPATRDDVKYRILELTQSFFNAAYNSDTLTAGKFFIDGNVMENCDEVTAGNWEKGVQGKDVNEVTKAFSMLLKPVPYIQISTESAADAFRNILQRAGCSVSRDDVDKRIVAEVKSGKEKYGASYAGGGKGIIDSTADAGGWPELLTTEILRDTDKDGMPDKWEKSNGLNPNDVSDGTSFIISKDYTNVEVYLNSLVTG